MNKTLGMILLSLALTPLLFAQASNRPESAGTLGLRFYGGLNYLYADELNRGLAGRLDLWRYAAVAEGLSGDARLAGAHWGYDAGADLLIPLNPRLSLQLGLAFITASARLQAEYPSQDVVPSNQEVMIRLRAMPVQAGLSYLLPVSRGLDVRIQAGAVYFLARPEAEHTRDWAGYWEKDRYVLKAGGFGYQGGLSLEFRLNRWAAVFLEGRGRLARVPNFSGSLDLTSSEEGQVHIEGELYAYSYKLVEGAIFPIVDVLGEEPSGPAFSEIRKAVVDFSGFSLNLGLTLKF